MATGKVLQFDPGRGYGFVAADDGGEDIFLHASVFDGDPGELVPGAPLEFQVMAGEAGGGGVAGGWPGEKTRPPPPPAPSPPRGPVPGGAGGALHGEKARSHAAAGPVRPGVRRRRGRGRADVRRAVPRRIRDGTHRTAAADDTGAYRGADPGDTAGLSRVRQETRLARRLIQGFRLPR